MIFRIRSLLIACLLGTTLHAADALNPAWWRGFGDPQLDALIGEALAANPDLKIAAARLGVAHAALTAARAGRRPSLALGAGAQRRAFSRTERAADPALNTAATALSLGPAATYEIDLWGRLSHGTDAAAEEARAAAEDIAALRLAIAGEIADTWFALRANAAETARRDTREAHARTALALLEARQSAGLSDVQPAATQRAALATLARESAALIRERTLLSHRLAALRGLRPEAAPPLTIPPLESISSQPLPAGLTTEVLARRPDLRAARARLAAQQSRVGEARAAALPALALSAQGLFSGESIRELLRTGSLGSFIAAQLTVPLLDGGRRAARTESARAELAVATETFAALTVRAFQETADALAAVDAARAERAAAVATLAARRALHASAEANHAAGRIDRLRLLAADDDVLVAETGLVRAHMAEHLALVALAKTLGGNWSAEPVALAIHAR
jgi:outer membrane protein, multidrug efflux system